MRIPLSAYLTRHTVKGAFGEFGDQEASRIDRSRHGRVAMRHAFEAGFAVVGLVADQNNQLMAFGAGLTERAPSVPPWVGPLAPPAGASARTRAAFRSRRGDASVLS